MTRDKQEMALWRRVAVDEGFGFADEAVEQFRKRYPPQTVAPEAVWYNEPPFPKDGTTRPCWIAGHSSPSLVYWAGRNWRAWSPGDRNPDHLNGRRVCPITRPPEPNQ